MCGRIDLTRVNRTQVRQAARGSKPGLSVVDTARATSFLHSYPRHWYDCLCPNDRILRIPVAPFVGCVRPRAVPAPEYLLGGGAALDAAPWCPSSISQTSAVRFWHHRRFRIFSYSRRAARFFRGIGAAAAASRWEGCGRPGLVRRTSVATRREEITFAIMVLPFRISTTGVAFTTRRQRSSRSFLDGASDYSMRCRPG
jgi:hypothetical protein